MITDETENAILACLCISLGLSNDCDLLVWICKYVGWVKAKPCSSVHICFQFFTEVGTQ